LNTEQSITSFSYKHAIEPAKIIHRFESIKKANIAKARGTQGNILLTSPHERATMPIS